MTQRVPERNDPLSPSNTSLNLNIPQQQQQQYGELKNPQQDSQKGKETAERMLEMFLGKCRYSFNHTFVDLKFG
jgi:hypothetical protein